MSVTILSATILSVIITSDNVNWVQFNRGMEICSVPLRPDKAGAILVILVFEFDYLLHSREMISSCLNAKTRRAGESISVSI